MWGVGVRGVLACGCCGCVVGVNETIGATRSLPPNGEVDGLLGLMLAGGPTALVASGRATGANEAQRPSVNEALRPSVNEALRPAVDEALRPCAASGRATGGLGTTGLAVCDFGASGLDASMSEGSFHFPEETHLGEGDRVRDRVRVRVRVRVGVGDRVRVIGCG